MPTTSEHFTAYMPRRTLLLQNGKTAVRTNAVNPMTAQQFVPFDIQPPSNIQSTTPREVNVSMDDIEDLETKKRRVGFWLSALVALLALGIIGASVALGFLLNRNNETTTSTTEMSSMDPTTVTTETTTTTATTSTANCVSPYVRGPSGNCVNLLVDFNNCGVIGNNCSSNYTSCSAGVCSSAPAVQLANSAEVWTASVNGSVDDSYFGVTLPFNITLYSTTTNYVYVTTNGVLCLGSCAATYTETALPAAPFPGATVLPFWDDLYIYSGTAQGIYFAPEGNAPNRTLVFEFYMSHFNQPSQYYHFQVLFFEARPGVVQYKYYDASDGGVSCTVGVQASSSGPFIQYSFDLANSIRSNMSLTFDTNFGFYTNSTF